VAQAVAWMEKKSHPGPNRCMASLNSGLSHPVRSDTRNRRCRTTPAARTTAAGPVPRSQDSRAYLVGRVCLSQSCTRTVQARQATYLQSSQGPVVVRNVVQP
jgi:hypothetical protein